MSATQPVSGVDNSPASKRKMANARDQSLNHLLNFSLPPRQPRVLPPPRRSRKVGTGQGFWNKEKFLNAQYRFIMNPTGDYTVHFADPDIHFQWNDILQVIVPRSSALSAASSSSQNGADGSITCPICLSPPAAPRMTKCGHIYCFACILHYLGTSETNKWARCPICFDTVVSHQLRSVHWIEESARPESGVLEMRLMERPQITTLALPRSATWPSDIVAPHQAPFHFMPDVFAYAKFMLATSDYMVSELARELEELVIERRTLMRLGDSLSVSFIDAADEKIRRQLQKAMALDTPLLREAVLRARKEAELLIKRAQRRAEYEVQRREGASAASNAVDDAVGEVPDALLQSSGRQSRQRKNVNPPPPSSQTYYFYQAATGAPVFLHPLDIRTLVARFGGYSALPDTISVRVEAAQEGSVDDALRKRCKYLGHFAESADVVFVEADLREVVGDDALIPFEAALRMRRSRRKDKDKKDDKARAKAEANERVRLGIKPVEAVATALPAEIWEELPTEVNAPAAPPAPIVEIDTTEQDYAPPPAPALSGVWGSRSFAGVLNDTLPSAPPRRTHDHEEEEELDSAWAELEVRADNISKRGGKKQKLVLISGGGGGARRRR